jgi:hypothetical protein
MPPTDATTHTLRILARDPTVRIGNKLLVADVAVPAEKLYVGPWGHRVQVIDYDASTGALLKPLRYETDAKGRIIDPFAKVASPKRLIGDPLFHQQNVYAIVMRTLAQFERILGRRINWGFHSHQIKVVPHAFEDANAFYSEYDRTLFFGYFSGPDGPVFTCLAHDIIVHETTHAVLDGLRERFTDPSSDDQAAFHEGFADVVAVLSIFQLPETVRYLLSQVRGTSSKRLVPRRFLKDEAFVRDVLLSMATQLGSALYGIPGRALRASYSTNPDPSAYRNSPEWREAHRRGELLVGAMLRAFVKVWQARLEPLGVGGSGDLDRERVIEEGANAAEHLLNIAIRGLDYTPPVHLTFRDYLSAILTADREIQPDDRKYEYRRILRESFKEWGITPGATEPDEDRGETAPLESGLWCPLDPSRLSYDGVRHEAMRRDPDEVFKFLWQNHELLQLRPDAFSEVLSVRPCRRVAPDGALLNETVAEIRQILDLSSHELKDTELAVFHPAEPEGDEAEERPADKAFELTGGGTFIFDDFGVLKYHIHNRVDNMTVQRERLLNMRTSPMAAVPVSRRFAELHRMRSAGANRATAEWW